MSNRPCPRAKREVTAHPRKLSQTAAPPTQALGEAVPRAGTHVGPARAAPFQGSYKPIDLIQLHEKGTVITPISQMETPRQRTPWLAKAVRLLKALHGEDQAAGPSAGHGLTRGWPGRD